ncbi:MAG: phosphoribosylaminoimidazolesuccinocarboxamide synthase [archaeon]
MNVVTKLNLPFKHVNSGKVREMYDLGDNYLMVATDRISAFDHILPNGIPYKGVVLTKLSVFWFDLIKDIVPNHVVQWDFAQFPEELRQHIELQDRSLIVKKAKPFPIECIVRGYLAGSGWKEYQKTGKVCGQELPGGLTNGEQLPQPIFTPSTKAAVGGHDVNTSIDEAAKQVGDVIYELQEKSIAIYNKAAEYALTKNIILADTKFEFGKFGNEVIIIDEVLTPDSSRFWPFDNYVPGADQPSFDKQYVRDYLVSQNWNKAPPVPKLPPEVVKNTSDKYLEAYVRLVGEELF